MLLDSDIQSACNVLESRLEFLMLNDFEACKMTIPQSIRKAVQNEKLSHGAFRIFSLLVLDSNRNWESSKSFLDFQTQIGCRQHSVPKWIDELKQESLINFRSESKREKTIYKILS